MKRVGNYFACLAIILVVLYVLYMFLRSSKQPFENGKNSTFKASTKYADASYTISADGETLYITINYKDLKDVSAVHIHTNNNGSPGPIIAWLGTTDEWQQGVTQNTPGKNSPCCNVNNPLCTLAAPMGTPLIQELTNSVRTFTITNSCSKDCPWIENGTLLVIHGYNFQRVVNGKLTKDAPGIDPIAHVEFEAK
jgi:hypothetical protein